MIVKMIYIIMLKHENIWWKIVWLNEWVWVYKEIVYDYSNVVDVDSEDGDGW